MKVQVLILLSLMCYTAFSTFAKTHGVGAGSSAVQLGLETTGVTCSVHNFDSSQKWDFTLATGTCVPKGLFMIGSNVWVVLQVSDDADLLVAANSNQADTNNYPTTPATPMDTSSTLVGDSVVIGRINLDATAPNTWGKFTWATYYASNDGTAFGAFAVTETAGCRTNQNLIQIKGDVVSPLALIKQDGTTLAAATGTGTYVVFDATGPSPYTFTPYAPTTAFCVIPPEEEEEEVEEETKSAPILSMTSALLMIAGIFNL